MVYNKYVSSNRLTRAGKRIQKVVKLCKTWKPVPPPNRDARLPRRKPSQSQNVVPKPSLQLIRARYYHAELGRFISRDPIGYVDGMSLYRAYFVPGGADPSGKACCTEEKRGKRPRGLVLETYDIPKLNDVQLGPDGYVTNVEEINNKIIESAKEEFRKRGNYDVAKMHYVGIDRKTGGIFGFHLWNQMVG